MLNWLKRRAKVSFNNRYTNILRRPNSPEMFLTEQSMINQQQANNESIKLLVFSIEGEEYALEVPLEMTLDKVKLMAIGHFYDPAEATGSPAGMDIDGECECAESYALGSKYRLILARDFRNLPEDVSVASEELVDNDEILLVQCRKPNLKPSQSGQSKYVNFNLEDLPPSLEQVRLATSNVACKNWDRQVDTVISTLDFKFALRQILLTMIEASIHLMAPEDNAADLFVLVFEHLEKRHKPRVDRNSLKQLTDMGFSEARAIKALQLKRNVMVDAMEWLLDETNKQHSGVEAESDILLLPPERRKSFFMSGRNPAEKVLQEFNKYVEKWFVPDSTALQNLVATGYGEDLSREALRICCNNEKLATEFLEGKLGDNFQRGFERDSPIMSAIFDSPVVQVALSKPKTLFALMILCETPSNVNVWLSDPETHPVVSQVLNIYHAEKHRLRIDGYKPAVETESSSGCSPPHDDATTDVDSMNEVEERPSQLNAGATSSGGSSSSSGGCSRTDSTNPIPSDEACSSASMEPPGSAEENSEDKSNFRMEEDDKVDDGEACFMVH